MKKSLGAKPLAFPAAAWVVAAYDAAGRANAMTIAWGGICCSKPPCLTVSLRKATYTYECIRARKAYTVNIPSSALAAQVDYLGIASGRDGDKLAAAGLTAVHSELVDAPWLPEFPMVLECALLHEFEIGLHTQFIGEIKDVKVDETCLGPDGKPNILAVDPLVFAPEVRAYHKVGEFVGQAFSMGKELKP